MAVKIKLRVFGRGAGGVTWLTLKEESPRRRALLDDLSKLNDTKFIKQGCITIVNKKPVVDDVELSDGDEVEILLSGHVGDYIWMKLFVTNPEVCT